MNQLACTHQIKLKTLISH